MRIRRSRLTRDFLQVPNATVRDDRLSHMARGILVDLLSRPDGWEATADEMWRASTDKHGKASPGRRQFRAAFAELKERGYLTPNREVLPGGLRATVLTLTDVPNTAASSSKTPGRTDVPHAGTSVRPGETPKTAGRTDVPHAGTSVGATDVPHAGTSVPPAETSNCPDGADVPHGGTPVPPAETDVFAGRTDVPHAGTSSYENGEKKTGEKTSSSALAPLPRHEDDEDLSEFGRFWLLHPKSRDRGRTLDAWRAAVADGADPKQISEAAQAYARERAGEPLQYTKLSHTWLRDGRYHDRYAPEPTPDGRPALRAVSGDHYPTSRDRQQQATDDMFDRAMARARTRMQQESS